MKKHHEAVTAADPSPDAEKKKKRAKGGGGACGEKERDTSALQRIRDGPQGDADRSSRKSKVDSSGKDRTLQNFKNLKRGLKTRRRRAKSKSMEQRA